MGGRPILVTGASGQLGAELCQALAPHGAVVATTHAELDLADPDAIVATMRRVSPALVVNAAAYTAVDLAEREGARADAVNGVAPGVLADEARRAGALLVHYSTDYVFDGMASAPYDEDAPARPLSAYGRSKLAGERAIAASGAKALVLRTSWVYGRRGKNFLTTMQRLARERHEIRVVDDQTGVPNWSRELARATSRLVAHGIPWLAERNGLYHLSAHGSTTWYGFARTLLAGVPGVTVVPITTAEYPTPARRPSYGVLGTARFERTFGFALDDWRISLAACLASDAEPDRERVGERPG
ncbi:MAG TPA: dTDP-4-dehydrorhamnose reductase [Casimicrobiaceae bacterium]|nr:dTDP-4-dehydrorhamnose reductase [Casimicrobiaceae bacterium]